MQAKLDAASAATLPSAIFKLPSGWLIAGDHQWLTGYCVLIADPLVVDFNALTEKRRAQWGVDIGRVGDALLRVGGAYRINYETWGNLTPALHTHIVPRFANEPEALRVQPPRQAYAWEKGRPFDLAKDGEWMKKIADYLARD